ncbi:STAS/SEC14 domain-containing protein [Trinickia soli]|uniref:STAS/SEC14 domain-containing protein n=1 Tax=Trinickia soli TaxID=380675 RepID=UPI001257E7D0|nr:STAS/SEC14 domain-containing protein [Paraburkholderia sp. T12-10]
MLETLANMPDDVVGFVASGRVTRKDYEDVLIPKVESVLKTHDKVRFYYELGSAFSGMEPGAMWEDAKVGISHLRQWDRIAVVTDVEWIRIALRAFGFAIPGDLRVFSNSEAAQARQWIVARERPTDDASPPSP